MALTALFLLVLCYAKLLSIIFQSIQRKEERRGCLWFCSLLISLLSKNVDLLGYFFNQARY